MSLTAAQTKGRIKNLATQKGADPRVLMRMYMMERFLERVSLSKYKDNFVIKGGLLITAMVGVAMRSTMDIDTSIKNAELSLANARKIVEEVISVSIDDGIVFEIKDVETIMDEMEYPGIRIHLNALMEMMITPIKIDISTGDAVTPRAIDYKYKLLLEERVISLWAYNLETVLAEKLQTILVRERANTRMRDLYDVYTLIKLYRHELNTEQFKMAYHATCKKRGTTQLIGHEKGIIGIIEQDEGLQLLWQNYRKRFSYAKDISYPDTIECIMTLIYLMEV